MKHAIRQLADRSFTALALLAVLLVVAALVGLLLPIIWRGSSAVVFQGTVEFRRMQLEQFGHGDSAAVDAEAAQVQQVRQRAYEIFDSFSAGLDTEQLESKVRQTHRQLTTQVANRDLPPQESASLRELSRQLRDELLAALGASDSAAAQKQLDEVLGHADDPAFKGTTAVAYFDIARQYQRFVKGGGFDRRAEYAQSAKEVGEALRALLGQRPGEPLAALVMDQYGATRWDKALQELDHLLYDRQWIAGGDGGAMKQGKVPRVQQFAGTQMAELFPYVEQHVGEMLHPRWTLYWRYFTDDNISGHYFGGVAPEILGTLLVTVLAVLVALPLGVIAAAYLVECAPDNSSTRALRMCINTLAGVPSIVFGLFGVAFFVIYLLPKFGLPAGSSILAGALTLALLVLPVIIRASEEAIRSVPPAYREASLALGSSPFHCFITVTLPAALPGILTGLILSMSRAAGETAPILFTAAVAMGPIPRSLTQPTRTLSYGAYDMAVGDKIAMLAPHNQFGMVMTLVGIVLLLNAAAIFLRGRIARRLRG